VTELPGTAPNFLVSHIFFTQQRIILTGEWAGQKKSFFTHHLILKQDIKWFPYSVTEKWGRHLAGKRQQVAQAG
jgi:hypothetical protein